MAEAVADRVYQDANSDDKISRAVERVKFAQQVLQLADSLDEKESLAKEVKEAVDHADKGVDVSSFSKNADLLYRLAQDGLLRNDGKYVHVRECLARLAMESNQGDLYMYKSRKQALDDLYAIHKQPAGDGSQQGKHELKCFPMMTKEQTRRGYSIIINVKTFDGKDIPSRRGSRNDAIKMKRLAEWLQFEVPDEFYEEDAQGNILEIFQSKLKRMAYDPKSDWLMCCFMSHGAQDCLMSSNGKLVHIHQLFNATRDPSLAALSKSSLPKIFILQACREQYMPDIPPAPTCEVELSNMLYMYATRYGEKAYRIDNGSHYLRILDKCLRELVPQRKHLCDILIEVYNICEKNRLSTMAGNGVEEVCQRPSFVVEMGCSIMLDWPDRVRRDP